MQLPWRSNVVIGLSPALNQWNMASVGSHRWLQGQNQSLGSHNPASQAPAGCVRRAMLERFSDFFYDPVVFWSAPLVLVAVAVGWRRVRAWGRRRFSATPPGHGPGGPLHPGDDD